MIQAKKTELMQTFQMQELGEKIKELEPEDNEKVYSNKFLRGIDPNKFRLSTPFFSFIKTPNIYLELISYSEFLTQPITTSFWAVQIKKNYLKLKSTRQPYKHNKPLCYL